MIWQRYPLKSSSFCVSKISPSHQTLAGEVRPSELLQREHQRLCPLGGGDWSSYNDIVKSLAPKVQDTPRRGWFPTTSSDFCGIPPCFSIRLGWENRDCEFAAAMQVIEAPAPGPGEVWAKIWVAIALFWKGSDLQGEKRPQAKQKPISMSYLNSIEPWQPVCFLTAFIFSCVLFGLSHLPCISLYESTRFVRDNHLCTITRHQRNLSTQTYLCMCPCLS